MKPPSDAKSFSCDLRRRFGRGTRRLYQAPAKLAGRSGRRDRHRQSFASDDHAAARNPSALHEDAGRIDLAGSVHPTRPCFHHPATARSARWNGKLVAVIVSGYEGDGATRYARFEKLVESRSRRRSKRPNSQTCQKALSRAGAWISYGLPRTSPWKSRRSQSPIVWHPAPGRAGL